MMRSDAMRMSVDRKDDVGENARLSPVHLVIVDARVPDLTRLIEALPIHTKVVVLPHNKDALSQLHRVLSIDYNSIVHLRPIAGLHLVGHGQPGRLLLGRGWLDASSIEQHFDEWYALTQMLEDDAQCWVYGCHTGQGVAGHAFINALADALCVHVHAASHPIGACERGGRWQFDRSTTPYSSKHNPVVQRWQQSGWGHLLHCPVTSVSHLTWRCVPFAQLQPQALYAVLRLRSAVFVMEQQRCIQILDNADQDSHHLMATNSENDLLAYARLMPPNLATSHASIDQLVIVASFRNQGIGHELLSRACEWLTLLWGTRPIHIGVPSAWAAFCQQHGFQPTPQYDPNSPHLLTTNDVELLRQPTLF